MEDGNHGNDRPRPEEFGSGNTAFIRAADMDGGRVLFESADKINDVALARIRKGKGKPGDILFSSKGTVGKLSIVQMDAPPFICSPQTTYWRTLDENKLNRSFLYAFMQSSWFTDQWEAIKGDTDMADYASLTSQRKFRVPLPDIKFQRTVASVFRPLDDKIELNRRMNRTLEELAAALFRSWFVDFDPAVAKAGGRKPAHLCPDLAALFPAHFQDSPLGPIPHGWRVASLSEIAAVNARKLPRDYPHKEIEYLDISSVTEGVITGTTRVKRDSAPSRAQRLVAHGDTIWSCVRPNRRSFALIQDPPENMVVSTGFATLSPTCDSAALVYTATTTDDFTDYLTAHAEGSAYPAVRPETFETAPLVVPTVEVLSAFEATVAPWLAQVAHNIRESRTLAALRDTLLPKLLSGELRVKTAEKELASHA